MRIAIIEQTDMFTLESTGNGAAYEFTNKRTGATKFVQYGDDATAFREYYDAMADAYANPASVWHRQSWNACLAELFDNA